MTFTVRHYAGRFILTVSDGRRSECFEFGHPEAVVAWVRTVRR